MSYMLCTRSDEDALLNHPESLNTRNIAYIYLVVDSGVSSGRFQQTHEIIDFAIFIILESQRHPNAVRGLFLLQYAQNFVSFRQLLKVQLDHLIRIPQWDLNRRRRHD